MGKSLRDESDDDSENIAKAKFWFADVILSGSLLNLLVRIFRASNLFTTSTTTSAAWDYRA
jgi:hypothetical protein